MNWAFNTRYIFSQLERLAVQDKNINGGLLVRTHTLSIEFYPFLFQGAGEGTSEPHLNKFHDTRQYHMILGLLGDQ